MCILFLLVGDEKSPTLICNNRDEYYNRRTRRGELSVHGSHYAPLDLEGGGTWISMHGMNDSADKFRYAIVLNFHHWRERYPFARNAPIRTNGNNAYSNMSKLKSRGLLIKSFCDDSNLQAEEYGNQIYANRLLYRPFNLIISDQSGTYYVCSSVQQRSPERLQPGRIYSISNGYLYDVWKKTSIGKGLFETCLTERSLFAHDCPVVTQQPDQYSTAQCDDGPLKPHLLTNKDIQPLLHKLTKIMEHDAILADPTFGNQSVPAMQLGSIYVKPTLIIRKPALKCAYTLKHMILQIIHMVLAVGKFLGQYLTGQLPEHTSSSPAGFLSDLLHQMLLFIPRAMVLGIFLLPTYDQGSFTHEEDVFGTRTITVAGYFPISLGNSATKSKTNKPSPKASSTGGHKFYIVERDLDSSSLQWSDRDFTDVI